MAYYTRRTFLLPPNSPARHPLRVRASTAATRRTLRLRFHHRNAASAITQVNPPPPLHRPTHAHPCLRVLPVRSSLLRHLLLLLRPFWHRFRLRPVTLRILHVCITVGAAALMVRVKLLANLGLRVRLKVLVNALVILVGTTPVRRRSVVARRQILILERCRKDGSRLHIAALVLVATPGTLLLTSSAISFFVLMPLARKKFSSGCCSSLSHVSCLLPPMSCSSL